MRALVRAFVATTVLSAAPALFAQQPTVVHGQVTTEAARPWTRCSNRWLEATERCGVGRLLDPGNQQVFFGMELRAELTILKAMATPSSTNPMETTNRPIMP